MTEDEYEAALERINELWDTVSDTSDDRELAKLLLDVQAYEDEHYPIDPPSAEAMEEFRREQEGKTDGG